MLETIDPNPASKPTIEASPREVVILGVISLIVLSFVFYSGFLTLRDYLELKIKENDPS